MKGDIGPVEAALAWRPHELPRIRTLLGLRRYWMSELYPAVRRQYRETIRDQGEPASMEDAVPLVESLPAASRFLWLDRYVQLRLWEEVGRMATDRLADDPDLLEPNDRDLGTLELDHEFDHPEYYEEYDFHRQPGGIWRGDHGALVYAMGARVIHVDSDHPFALHEGLVDSIPADQPRRVLDMGCGFGKTTFFLKQRYGDAEVEGVDVSAPVLRLGRKMATERGLDIRWLQADAEHLPVEEERYDVVALSMVLHELPMRSIYGMVEEAHRVLKPGGVFVALETRLTGDVLRDLLGAWHSEITGEPYINAFRAADFGEFPTKAGFSRVEVEDWHVPGARPGSELDPERWATAWSLLKAYKE